MQKETTLRQKRNSIQRAQLRSVRYYFFFFGARVLTLLCCNYWYELKVTINN